jgi:hypothetical protein
MNLIETIRKLMERGCEPHPRLVYYEWTGTGGAWYLDKATRFCAASDARDLWTMWALRWLNTMSYVGSFNGVNALMVSVGVCSVHWRPLGKDEIEGRGPTLLDAIEAATAHLSPKEPNNDT